MENLRWSLQWLSRKRWLLPFSILLSMLAIGTMVVEPFIFRSIIDDVIMDGNVERLLPLLGLSLCFGIAHPLIRYCYNMVCETMSQEAVYNMRLAFFKRILGQAPSFFRDNVAGDLITLCTGDIEIVRHFICWVIPRAVECVVLLIVVLSVFISVSPLYALCLFALTPISAFVAIKLSRHIRPAHGRVREQRARLSTVVTENISGNRVIRAFTREPFEIEKFRRENAAFRDRQVETNSIWLKYQPILELVALALNSLTLILGGVLVILGHVTVGSMNIFLSMVWALNEPMLSIGNIINDGQRFVASAEKLQQVYYFRNNIKSPETALAPQIQGRIQMKNVGLSVGGVSILKNVNLEIPQGATIGIMGPTGSGKTVLASLISRFIDPTAGSVSIAPASTCSARCSFRRCVCRAIRASAARRFCDCSGAPIPIRHRSSATF